MGIFLISGHLGRTFSKTPEFSETPFTNATGKAAGTTTFGINENDKDYKNSRWCFDTPGVVQPDQV